MLQIQLWKQYMTYQLTPAWASTFASNHVDPHWRGSVQVLVYYPDAFIILLWHKMLILNFMMQVISCSLCNVPCSHAECYTSTQEFVWVMTSLLQFKWVLKSKIAMADSRFNYPSKYHGKRLISIPQLFMFYFLTC